MLSLRVTGPDVVETLGLYLPVFCKTGDDEIRRKFLRRRILVGIGRATDISTRHPHVEHHPSSWNRQPFVNSFAPTLKILAVWGMLGDL